MKSTHFGFQQIRPEEKADKVAEVFDSVATKYDLMNDLMSFGVHRLWKRFTVEIGAVREGHAVLDLAGGTADLARHLARRVGERGQVVVADINESMINVGRDRLLDRGIVSNVRYTQCDAERLPFPDNTFHCITIAFGLRNVTDKERALTEMQRVTKPGGKVLVLEFSHLTVQALRPLYDLYSFKALPLLGKLIAGDAASYRYLAESIRMHPDQETLKSMMEAAGFGLCDYFNLSGGVAALHRGWKL